MTEAEIQQLKLETGVHRVVALAETREQIYCEAHKHYEQMLAEAKQREGQLHNQILKAKRALRTGDVKAALKALD